MWIDYLTLDEVNRYLVRRWTAGMGVRLTCSAVGPSPDGGKSRRGVILDLDFLPADIRTAWIRRVLVGGVGCPVFAHGHNVSDEDVAALRQYGVRVCRGRLRKAALNEWLGRVPAGRE